MKIIILFFLSFDVFFSGKHASLPNDAGKSLNHSGTNSSIKIDSILGVFDGRTPCTGIPAKLNEHENISPGCLKIKWRLILYQDPITFEPTTYELIGFMYKKDTPRKGKWTKTRGTKTDPEAVVYQLDPDKPLISLMFLKGDDNVLFFLDKEKNLMVGNGDFSYTLNRKDYVYKN